MIQGFELSYEGVGQQANRGFKYLNPFLSTSRRVFAELNSDQRALREPDRRRLAALRRARRARARHLGAGRQPEPDDERDRRPQGARSPQAIALLPDFMRNANTTFVNLRAALDDLDPLVERLEAGRRASCARSSPSCAPPPPTPCRRSATSTRSSRRPGADNDLVELTAPAARRCRAPRSAPARPTAAPGPTTPTTSQVAADDDFTQGAFGESVCSLDNGSPTSPSSAPTRPSWSAGSTTSGTPATIDANGGIGRDRDARSTPSASPAPAGLPDLHRPAVRRASSPPRSTTGHDPPLPGRQRAAGHRRRPLRRLGPVHRRRRAHRRRRRRLRPDPGAAGPMRRIALILAPARRRRSPASRRPPGADDTHTYKIEMDNAFGIVEGSDVRVAGVNAGHGHRPRHQRREAGGGHGRAHRASSARSARTRRCSSEPQSLIAEYFIDCEPAGPPLAEDDDADDPDPDIPAEPASRRRSRPTSSRTRCASRSAAPDAADQRVRHRARRQPREPQRGDPPRRPGADASSRKVTADPRRARTRSSATSTSNSDQVIAGSPSAARTSSRFIQEARDTAAASAARREDLSRDFELLDDFLAELRPTLAELDNLAVEQTPLLTDLRAAAPRAQPPRGQPAAVQRAPPRPRSTASARRRWSASTALRRGARRDRAARRGRRRRRRATAEILADFLRDLDDPRRAVEIDDRVDGRHRAHRPEPGHRDTKGYTGLEGLLNYVYYQAGAINQFDQIGHLLHFSLYDVFTGPVRQLHHAAATRQTGEPGVPADGRRHDHQHPRGRPLRRLAGPEPAGHQRGPRPAAVRPVGLPGRHRARGRRRSSATRRAAARAERGGRSAQAAGAAAAQQRRRATPAAAPAASGGRPPAPLRRRRTARDRSRRHPRRHPRPAARGARRPARRPPGRSSAAARRAPAARGGGAGAGRPTTSSTSCSN